MKVLVTGGAGFIGSHIVDALLSRGFDVEVLDDLSSGVKSNLDSRVTLHHFDIRSPDAAHVVSRGNFDVIVHAAAQISVRRSMEDPKFDTDVNVCGLVNLLSVIRGTKTRVVFISTGGAMYGDTPVMPTPETETPLPESAYGMAKFVSEQYLDLWNRAWGTVFTSLRLANVYGPRQNPHGEAGVVAIFCTSLNSGKTLYVNGDGDQTRDFINVRDVADAVRRAVEEPRPGIFNVGTGVENSVNDLVSALAVASGTAPDIQYNPAKPGEQRRSCIDATKAKNALGWQPSVSFKQGVAETLEWFKVHKS